MHVSDTGSWTLGTLIGTPLAGVITGLCLLAFLVGIGMWLKLRWPVKGESAYNLMNREDKARMGLEAAAVGAGVAILTAGIWTGCMWPLDAEYHQLRTTTGVVQNVASRQVSDGDKGMETKFVVSYVGGGERGCTDTRCSLVKPGDTLTLKCVKIWQWQATPGYDCNFVNRVAG